jgi:hypothetical protein
MQSPSPARRRSFPRFSLRTLFLGITLSSFGAAFYVY